jgi:Protein of unknown function (DUF3047)
VRSRSIFHRGLIGLILFGLVLSTLPAFPVGSHALVEKLVEDWKTYAPGSVGVPGQWTLYRGFASPRNLPVVVKDAGRPALLLKTDNSSIRIMLAVDIDLAKTPVLRWDWKAVTLPRLGNAQSAVNDQVARVFLVFGSALRAKGLGYIWDTSAPVGAVITNTHTLLDRRLLVVRSGSAGVGAWQTETRNVLADYEKLFGAAPGHVRAVGIESHSEDANHKSEALFGALAFTSTQ